MTDYLSIALGAGDTTVLKLTNAYAILANQGRAVKPTLIDYVQDRNGKVIYRTDNRCAVMDNCNAADWDGKAMPRPPCAPRQLLDPQAAYQMVHILEGVVERGTATVLRDLDRPLFGKTGTTSGPTNVWFVGGTPDIVAGVYLGYDQPRPMGGYAPGRADRRADLQAIRRRPRSRTCPKIPFVAPPGIRMVRDRPRHRASRVFGTFPTDRGSQVVGDLGSVPAARPSRAARSAGASSWPRRRRDAAAAATPAARRAPRARPRPQPRAAGAGRQRRILAKRRAAIY